MSPFSQTRSEVEVPPAAYKRLRQIELWIVIDEQNLLVSTVVLPSGKQSADVSTDSRLIDAALRVHDSDDYAHETERPRPQNSRHSGTDTELQREPYTILSPPTDFHRTGSKRDQ